MKIFVFGSSIVSSYWNGAATYYRGVYKSLDRLGHQITFAEPDAYNRQQHRDAGDYSYVRSLVYSPGRDIEAMLSLARQADVVIKHSGIGADDEVLEQRVLECQPRSLVLYWDVDAPATIARLHERPDDTFAHAVPRYDAILTYGGGPGVEREYRAFGARAFLGVYNGLDPQTHFPVPPDPEVASDLAFIGNRLPDREKRVEDLFLAAAHLAPEMHFLLGGEGWGDKPMPPNVRWIGHVPTTDHNRINSSARMVLNINRASMASFGFAPPTRVFEVAGSGSCLLCDDWPGIDECFTPGKELLVVRSAQDIAHALRTMDRAAAKTIGKAFHVRALRDHTYNRRAVLVDAALRARFRNHADDPTLLEQSA
jgi:spore maturation protein CgeB